MRSIARLLVPPLLACATAAAPARAEIYRWTDAEGRVHFTEDLSRVPPDQRPAARASAAEPPGAGRVQTYSSPPAARAPLRAAGASQGKRVHRIRVSREGNAMIVPVRLNGTTVAPFLLDTGASYVLVPARVAREAGIDFGPGTRTMTFMTANGAVEQPVVTLDRVELGTAAAERVAATVSDRIEMGLLGLSFLGRFTYQIDAAAGVVTLVENDLAERGAIVGGRTESQWRAEFRALRARLAEVAAARARTAPSKGRRLDRLDEEEAALARQLEELDAEADHANVPHEWRD